MSHLNNPSFDPGLLFQLVNDAVIVVDADWCIQEWNPAATQIYGWLEAEVYGRLISDMVPVVRYLNSDTDASTRATLLDTSAWRGMVVHCHRDRHERIIDSSIRAVRDTHGIIVAYIAINRDVTERAHAEEQARRQAKHMSILAEASAFLASSLDLETTLFHLLHLMVPRFADGCRVYLLNDAGHIDLSLVYHHDARLRELMNRLARLEPTAFSPQHPLSIVLRTGHTVLIPEVSVEQLMTLASDDSVLTLLQQLHPRSGLFVPLIVRGQTIGALALSITGDTRRFGPADRELALELAHRAAQAIDNARLYAASRKAEALLDALYATAPTGLAFVDRNLCYMRVNAALAEMHGLSVADHLGRNIREVLPHFAPMLETTCQQVLTTGQPILNLEINGETAATSGAHRTWLASYYPVQLPDTSVLGVGLVVVDITERKVAEAALKTMNAELTRALTLKDEFLAMMSHELRTPLNLVLATADSISMELHGPITAGQQRALARIRRGGRHLLTILSDILDLTRIAAGQMVLELESLDSQQIVWSALNLVEQRAQQKSIRLLNQSEINVPFVIGDERRLVQILVNLLDNAIKFTSAGGEVGLDVRLEDAQKQVLFTVWDTGIGIAASDMDRLFKPFTQIDGQLSRQYEGIGLGLTLVQRLVTLHGGSISVESQPGKGSRFTVTLQTVALHATS